MQEIENEAIETYQKNMEYLKEYDNELYSKLELFEQALSNNLYEPQYHLEYIKEDKQFDIYDSKEEKYLYDREPNKFIQEAVDITNFDKDNTYDMLNKKFYNNHDKTQCCGIYDYIKIFDKSTTDQDKRFQSFDKFIFIGTLLGTHIIPIDKKINAELYFITEAHLEIFRLSLFVTKYYEFAKRKTIVFSIMDTKEQFIGKLSELLKENWNANHILKCYPTYYRLEDYFDRIAETLNLYSPLTYPYTKILNLLLTHIYKNITKYPITPTTLETNDKILADRPVLVLAAGPSLAKNIEWLKKNQKDYFIIAIAATLKLILKEDITPDLIVSIDGGEVVKNHFPQEVVQKIENIPVLFSTLTDPNIISLIKKENVFLIEIMAILKTTSTNIAGVSVGEVTFQLAYILGANNIYLLGSDLALDQKTGSTHSSDYAHENIYNDNLEEIELNQTLKTGNYSLRSSLLKVKGNFQDSVVTTGLFHASIHFYNIIIQYIYERDNTVKIYNLNDGAYFEGAIPTKVEDIVLNTNNTKNISIKEYLQKKAVYGLTDEEKVDIVETLKTAKILVKKLTKFHKLNIKTYTEFVYQRQKHFNKMIFESNLNHNLYFAQLLVNYWQVIEPYIYYHINDQFSNEKQIIKKVKTTWINHMITLCEKYIDIVEKGVK